MESDYKFLLSVKYGDSVNSEKLFNIRVRNAIIVTVMLIFIFMMSKINFINVLLAFIIDS